MASYGILCRPPDGYVRGVYSRPLPAAFGWTWEKNDWGGKRVYDDREQAERVAQMKRNYSKAWRFEVVATA